MNVFGMHCHNLASGSIVYIAASTACRATAHSACVALSNTMYTMHL